MRTLKISWMTSDGAYHDSESRAIQHQIRLEHMGQLKQLYTNFCLYSDYMLDNAQEIINILQSYIKERESNAQGD
jgi:hypothetical protein